MLKKYSLSSSVTASGPETCSYPGHKRFYGFPWATLPTFDNMDASPICGESCRCVLAPTGLSLDFKMHELQITELVMETCELMVLCFTDIFTNLTVPNKIRVHIHFGVERLGKPRQLGQLNSNSIPIKSHVFFPYESIVNLLHKDR